LDSCVTSFCLISCFRTNHLTSLSSAFCQWLQTVRVQWSIFTGYLVKHSRKFRPEFPQCLVD
jgi:hypothetical protein